MEDFNGFEISDALRQRYVKFQVVVAAQLSVLGAEWELLHVLPETQMQMPAPPSQPYDNGGWRSGGPPSPPPPTAMPIPAAVTVGIHVYLMGQLREQHNAALEKLAADRLEAMTLANEQLNVLQRENAALEKTANERFAALEREKAATRLASDRAANLKIELDAATKRLEKLKTALGTVQFNALEEA